MTNAVEENMSADGGKVTRGQSEKAAKCKHGRKAAENKPAKTLTLDF